MPVGHKTECPISRNEFQVEAKPVVAEVNGVGRVVNPKMFSTGSFGWYENGKVTMKVGDKLVPCTLAIQITAINSRDVED